MALLFRHPTKGGELFNRAFGRWWKEPLVRVVLRYLATGVHGFRNGGYTAMTEFAGLDAGAESIRWTKKRMGERYAHRKDQKWTQLQTKMVRTEGSALARGLQPIWKE